MIAEEDSAGQSDESVNYFVPMTDMMVGVLFIFILMLMAFALDFRRTTDAQETALKVAHEVASKLDPLQSAVRDFSKVREHAKPSGCLGRMPDLAALRVFSRGIPFCS